MSTTYRVRLMAVLTASVFGGCAYGPALPDGYTGPKATIADTAVSQGPRMSHMFEIEKVDGRAITSSGMETVGRNQGRGLSMTPVTLTHPVAAVPTRFTISGATVYAAPILAMTNPTCRVIGDVAFSPVEGKTYMVTGQIEPEKCSVWIQDSSTGEVMGQKVTGAGLH